MKYVRLAILLLLIPLCCVAFAALSKTSNIGESEVDPWQKVLAGTLVVGNVSDIANGYRAIVYLEVVAADTDSQDGVPVKVEVSYGNDTWILLYEFTTPPHSPALSVLDGAVAAGDLTITLASPYGSNGQKFFIEDGEEDFDSESIRVKSVSGSILTLCHDLLRSHTTSTSVWDGVYEYILPIPAAFAAFRVTIHDIDTDADIYFTTRMSKVKEL